MLKTLLLVSLLFVLGVPASADEDQDERAARARQREEADRVYALRVNDAVSHGYEWLRAQQSSAGTFPLFTRENNPQHLGRQALVLYTLSRCGATLKHKVIQRGLEGLALWQKKVAYPGWGLKTYSVAMLILMYDALYRPRLESDEPVPGKDCQYPRTIRKEVQTLLDWIVQVQAERVWRYPGGQGGNEDLSHTQLVLLALQVAGHCGLEVAPSVYKKALTYVLDTQEADGPEQVLWLENPAWEPGVEDRYGRFLAGPKFAARGWSYLPNYGPTGSMTAAGIASLAIVKSRLGALDALDKHTSKKIDRCMLEGLAWLSKEFTVEENAGFESTWHYYYLWSLERVGSLLGRTHIGKHDWYREGADLLLLQQKPDGNWPGETEGLVKEQQDTILQTCFALLFLKRATTPSDTPVWPDVQPAVTPR